MDSGAVIDAMRNAAQTLRTGDVREKVHALQAVHHAADAAQAALLAELEASKDFELDGASTLNMWVRTAPRDAATFCWRIEIMPRLAQLAGLEIGTGVHLNVLAPEDAAQRLRDANV